MNSRETRPIDWEIIENDYRAGIKTLRQIAEENRCTHGAINKRAKRDGWERDLSAKIQAKADAMVSNALVSKGVSRSAAKDKQVIEANASVVADVRINQRASITRAKSIIEKLFDELEAQSGIDNVALLEQLGELMRDGDRDKLNDAYMAIIKLPERSKIAKTLIESLKSCVEMERQAYGINDVPKEEDPIATLIKQVSGTTIPIRHEIEYEVINNAPLSFMR